MTGCSTHDLELPTADGPMLVHEAIAASGADRAVIVIPVAFGLNGHIRAVTDRFADAGYRALGLDIFHRSGGGTAPYDDFKQVFPLFAGLDDAGLLADVDAALTHLAAEGIPAERVAIVGFCFGGRTTFLVAANRTIGAAVGFYGGGIAGQSKLGPFEPLIDRAADLRTPWLGLFGDLDQSIPPEVVEQLREALGGHAPVATEVVRYPDADHGFHCDERPAYHPASATDAWHRTLAWFDTHL